MSEADKMPSKQPAGDDPKRQGDKLGVGSVPPLKAGSTAPSGDSLKQQGDKLEHAVGEAAKR